MAKKQAPKQSKTESESKLAKPKTEPALAHAEVEPKLNQPANASSPAKAASGPKSVKPKSEPKPAKADAKVTHTKTESDMQFDPLRFAQPKKQPSPEERQMLIAESAYSRAASRSFEPGHEVEDWLAAEAEVDHHLNTQ